MKKFYYRNIYPEEGRQTAEIERICFPSNEALPEAAMIEKAAAAPGLFLTAVDAQTGKIAGFLNGLATDEESFRDEFYTNAALHYPNGKNILLLGLEVLPEYRGLGLASELMRRYIQREAAGGRKKLILTCVEDKVSMYLKMGFQDLGPSSSSWGEIRYHEMVYDLSSESKKGFCLPGNISEWIDTEKWPRMHLFENYDGTDFPYIIITGNIDVTNPLAFARRNQVSFNLVMVYLCTRTADSILNYRYRFLGGQPFVIAHSKPVITHLIPGEDLFVMGEGPWPCDDILTFCRLTHDTLARMTSERSLARLKGRLDLINYTSIPWLSYTGFIRTIKKNGTDNVPKISFGKYTERDGHFWMPVSSQTHHGLMDGCHVGLFYERLQEACDALPAAGNAQS